MRAISITLCELDQGFAYSKKELVQSNEQEQITEKSIIEKILVKNEKKVAYQKLMIFLKSWTYI